MKSALEIFFVCRARLDRERSRRLRSLPPQSAGEVLAALDFRADGRLETSDLAGVLASLFPRSEHKADIGRQLADYLDSSRRGLVDAADLERSLLLEGSSGDHVSGLLLKPARRQQVLGNLKQRLIAVVDWIVEVQTLKKKLYSMDGFNLERLFDCLAADCGAITPQSVKRFFGAKTIGLPSLVGDVLDLLRAGAAQQAESRISIKEFRLAITPEIHYLEALTIDEDDRRVALELSDATPSTAKDTVDDDYRLVEIDRPLFITGSHSTEPAELKPRVRADNDDFVHLRQFGADTPCRPRAKHEPGAPLSKKYCQSSDFEFDSLELPGRSPVSPADRFQEFADYPASTGSREFSTPANHGGFSGRLLDAPLKSLKAEFDDRTKKAITRQIDFGEENYWNLGHGNFADSKLEALLAPAPALQESLLLRSPAFLGGKPAGDAASHLKTTLPKDGEAGLRATDSKQIHRQISFENLG